MQTRKQTITAKNGRENKPLWNAATGELKWRGGLVMHLATQASAERAILDALKKRKWRFLVKNPLPRDTLGDKTGARRSAIHNLMRHQGKQPPIQFFSALDGYVAWCPSEWLAE